METVPANQDQIKISHERLHDDLLLLDGNIGTDGLFDESLTAEIASPFRLSREQIDDISDTVHDWLPQKIEELGGSTAAISEPEAGFDFVKSDEYEYVRYTSHQIYGYSPHAEDIKIGPVVEVGGPTGGYRSLESLYGVKPDIVTNVVTDKAKMGYTGKVDIAADATNMPFADASLGAVYASCLPGARRDREPEFAHIRPVAITEASRVIMPGGRLFWSGGTQADYDEILAAGFKPEGLVVTIYNQEELATGLFTRPEYNVDGIYIKG